MGKPIDLTGKVFGTWTCIKHIKKGVWLCRCENGHEREIQGYFLRKGEIPKCKECKASEVDNTTIKEKKIHVKENLIGSTFGNWRVVGYMGRSIWKCKCSCPLGTLRDISSYDLKMGRTRSCGCLKAEHFKNSIDYITNISELKNIIKAFECEYSYLPSLIELSEITGINRGTLYTYLKDKNILHIRDNSSIVNSKNIVEFDGRLPEELLKYSSSNRIKLEYINSTYDNELYHEVVYHQNKAISAMEDGVDLIQIFEYEWLDGCIRKKLIKLIEKKLYTDRNIVIQARKCEIRETEVNKCKEFLELNHLQGFAKSSINIGLYFEDSLVGLMTFGKPRFNSEYQYELIRLAWKDSIVITGGSERLFKYFIDKYKPDSIISYCDISKFNGSVYRKLGFNRCGITRPSYVWYNPNTKTTLSRYQTIKSKLVERGLGTDDMSEIEIMHSMGFVRIFDCGNIKFVWEKENNT